MEKYNPSVFKSFNLKDVKYIAKEIESRLNNIFKNDLFLDSKFKAKYNKEDKSYTVTTLYPKTKGTDFPSYEVFNESIKYVISLTKHGHGISIDTEFNNRITQISIKKEKTFHTTGINPKTKNLEEKLIKEKDKTISTIIQLSVSEIIFFLLKVYYLKTDVNFVANEFIGKNK